MLYTWIGILVFALAVEAVTTALFSIWFALGALVAIICGLCGAIEIVQCIVFIVVSAVTLTVYITKFRKRFMAKTKKTNLDAIIGSVATVEEDIPANGRGRVNAGSQSWSAVTYDGSAVAKGERVTVLAIEGVKLICVKA